MDDDAAQQAWNEWVQTQYFDRVSIQAAHRAFITAWKTGYDTGYTDASNDARG